MNIIDAKKIEGIKVLPDQTRGVIISYSYDGEKLAGYSKSLDRPTAIAEALVDVHEKIRNKK
ncbi:hypothetical protein AMJ47_02320 [Parcubacteria bacterium DG_72]|nr:MAG: hypothetical protein AMJ47_02320 [Parcubacteria bacterium DG_72]